MRKLVATLAIAVAAIGVAPARAEECTNPQCPVISYVGNGHPCPVCGKEPDDLGLVVPGWKW